MQSSILCDTGEALPGCLAAIPDPPDRLYRRGVWPNGRYIAIVGSRQATPYGRHVAGVVAARLARCEIVVVSGLAFGIDAVAHRAALEAGGKTVAVLPGGLDDPSISPRTHLQLAHQVARCGALVSEHPPGTGVRKEYYLHRNRLICGVAEAVIVVEAALSSGSLATAEHAARQGRDVWAIPGRIDSEQSRGCNELIAQGAYPLISVEGFLEALGVGAVSPQSDHPILQHLMGEPQHVERLVAETGLPPEAVDRELTKQELLGTIRHLGGRYYTMA